MNSAPTTVSTFPQIARAKALIDDAKYDQAAAVLIEFLRQRPDHPQAMARLGQVANHLGALGQAEHFLRKAIARGVSDFETRRHLASVLNQQDRPALALPMFEALANESGDSDLRAVQAGILEKIGQNDKSREMLRQLTRDRPDKPLFWIAYGHSLRFNGQVDEAIAAYRRAIAVDDGFGEAWWGLASIKKPVLGDDDIAAMRAALAIAVDDRNEAPLNFALARALHDKGDHESAFRHYSEGNRIRAETLKYDADELTEEVAEIEREVDRAYMAGLPSQTIGDRTPIFIVSLPRSGSTLLEQILGGHSAIEPVGELPYVPAILRTFMEMVTRRGKFSVPQAIASLSHEQAAALGREYLARAEVHSRSETVLFIDKLPHNWSNILFIRKILPQAKFIDIRRPAMDCCFSNFTQSFTSAHASSFTLHDVGRSYVDNVRLMDHFDRVAPGLVQHVDYARLIEDPRSQIAPVLDYLGLEWEDDVLEFHRLERVVRTPSSEQVRRPLNRDGMAVWRPYAQWLGPLRDVLGELGEYQAT